MNGSRIRKLSVALAQGSFELQSESLRRKDAGSTLNARI